MNKLVDGATNGLMNALGDPYSGYMNRNCRPDEQRYVRRIRWHRRCDHTDIETGGFEWWV